MKRSDGKKWRKAFLAALAETGIVSGAAEKAGVCRQTAYDHRKRDAAFAGLWDAAEECATRMVLEPEAVRRAVEGGSDQLLMFLLKSRAPEKYSEKSRQTNTNLNLDVTQLTDEQLDRISAGEDPALVLALTRPR